MFLPYEEIPLIINVSYLHGHVLLVSFDNGEERVWDTTHLLNIPPAMPYYPIQEFLKFRFDTHTVSWGDVNSRDSMDIGHDSIYNGSVRVSEFVAAEDNEGKQKKFEEDEWA